MESSYTEAYGYGMSSDEGGQRRRGRRRAGRGGWGGRGGRGARRRSRSRERKYRDRSARDRDGDRPPRGLKGKAIGMWYRDKSRRRKKANGEDYDDGKGGKRGRSKSPRKAEAVVLELKDSLIKNISDMLDGVKAKPPPHLVQKFSFTTSSPTKGSKEGSREVSNRGSREVINRGSREVINIGSREASNSTCEPTACANEKYSYLEDSIFKRRFLKSITGSIEASINRSLCITNGINPNSKLDEQFKRELEDKESNPSYREMLKFRKKLPSFNMRHEIVDMVEANQVIVISGETGCGKTTQVAQFILDSEIKKGAGSTCHIVCTQPRRISAISVAERVADERGENVGDGSVGYQIRLEKKLPRPRGSILFCTTGILLQYMQTDPALGSVSHVVIDEIHERDTVSDFIITILKSVLEKRKDSLKLVLMSATLNSERFSKYYSNSPMIKIPGFTFPVKEYYLEDVLQMTRFTLDKRNKRRPMVSLTKKKEYDDFIMPHIRKLKSTGLYSATVLDTLKDPEIEEVNIHLIESLVQYICFNLRQEGAILIFLPGWDKITALNKLLTESGRFPRNRFLIIPLHSLLPTTHQRTVFDRPPHGVRKIVIATNIAETSITIDDIVFVINSGKIKMKNFDVKNSITSLQPEWVSLANAHQRRGRAGRVQEGICYHLYSKAREMMLASYPIPEMLRTRLEEVILQAKLLQLGSIKPFLQKVLDPPDPASIDLSLKMLRTMNALDSDESLTPLGHHLAQLPVDPQVGKMILMSALFSCVDPILTVAASLSFKDAFIVPLDKEKEVNKVKDNFDQARKSDHLLMAEAFSRWEEAEHEGWGKQFCIDNFLIRNTLVQLKDMKRQFAEHLHQMKFLKHSNHKSKEANINSDNTGLLRAIICAGLYPNVAIIKKLIPRRGKVIPILCTEEDGTVGLHPRSVNDRAVSFESQFLLYHLKMKSTKIYLHDTTMVHPLPLFFFGHTVNMCEEKRLTVFELSNLMRFAVNQQIASLILDLRIRLDWILEQKISNPAVTDWSADSDEGAILRAITLLITTEDSKRMDAEYRDDYSDSDSDLSSPEYE